MIIVIPKLKIRGATAMANWGTIGFPSMAGWLGAMHRLQRDLNEMGHDTFRVDGTGVVVNKFKLRAYKKQSGRYWSVIGYGIPRNQYGCTPGFREDPKCDITASIVMKVNGLHDYEDKDIEQLITDIEKLLFMMKVVSGDTWLTRRPVAIYDRGELETRSMVRQQVMPGYAIIERRDLIQKAAIDNQDPMDAIIDYLKIYHISDPDGWFSQRKAAGWIVPISTGYNAISDYDVLPSQRDKDVLHRFAEGVTTLGEFVMPWRLKRVEDMLWRYAVEGNLYICKNSRQEKN
jgi:CRISPR-associated protein Csy2